MQIIKKYWKRALFSLFLLLTVLLSPHLISSWKTYRTNKQFEQYTDELFFADVQIRPRFLPAPCFGKAENRLWKNFLPNVFLNKTDSPKTSSVLPMKRNFFLEIIIFWKNI